MAARLDGISLSLRLSAAPMVAVCHALAHASIEVTLHSGG